jgi:hypothetical protein
MRCVECQVCSHCLGRLAGPVFQGRTVIREWKNSCQTGSTEPLKRLGASGGESEMSQSRHMRESWREARNTVVWDDKLVLDVLYGQVDHGTGFDGLRIAVARWSLIEHL